MFERCLVLTAAVFGIILDGSDLQEMFLRTEKFFWSHALFDPRDNIILPGLYTNGSWADYLKSTLPQSAMNFTGGDLSGFEIDDDLDLGFVRGAFDFSTEQNLDISMKILSFPTSDAANNVIKLQPSKRLGLNLETENFVRIVGGIEKCTGIRRVLLNELSAPYSIEPSAASQDPDALFDLSALPVEMAVEVILIEHEPAKIVFSDDPESVKVIPTSQFWSGRKKTLCACSLLPEFKEWTLPSENQVIIAHQLGVDCIDTSVISFLQVGSMDVVIQRAKHNIGEFHPPAERNFGPPLDSRRSAATSSLHNFLEGKSGAPQPSLISLYQPYAPRGEKVDPKTEEVAEIKRRNRENQVLRLENRKLKQEMKDLSEQLLNEVKDADAYKERVYDEADLPQRRQSIYKTYVPPTTEQDDVWVDKVLEQVGDTRNKRRVLIPTGLLAASQQLPWQPLNIPKGSATARVSSAGGKVNYVTNVLQQCSRREMHLFAHKLMESLKSSRDVLLRG